MAAIPEGNSHTSAGSTRISPASRADRLLFGRSVCFWRPVGQDPLGQSARKRFGPCAANTPSRRRAPRQARGQRKCAADRPPRQFPRVLSPCGQIPRSARRRGARGRRSNIRRAVRTSPRTSGTGEPPTDAERTSGSRIASGRSRADRPARIRHYRPTSAGRPKRRADSAEWAGPSRPPDRGVDRDPSA